MMYIIIIGSVAVILWILTDGLRGSSKNRTSNDKFSKFDSPKENGKGTFLNQAHTVSNWLFKSRH